eukprot:Hpha_TRINITY_DN12147_c1_g1::TRINITY_DN12147_c1_g1_i1::g.82071::m.82071
MGGSNSTEAEEPKGEKTLPFNLTLDSKHSDAKVLGGGRVEGSGSEEVLITGPLLPEGLSCFELTVGTQSQNRNWAVGVATDKQIKGWEGPGDGLWYKDEAWLCWDGGAVINGGKERRRDAAWWGHAGKKVIVRVDSKVSGRVDWWVEGQWQGGLGGAYGHGLRPILLITDGHAEMRSLDHAPDVPEDLAPCAKQWRLASRLPDLVRVSNDGLRVEGRSKEEVLVHGDWPLMPHGVHAWDVTVQQPSLNRNWTVGCATKAELDRWEGEGDGMWYKREAWVFWDGGGIMNGPESRRIDREQWGGAGQTITIRVDTATDGRVDFWIDGRWQGGLDGLRGKEVFPLLLLSDGVATVGQTMRAQSAINWKPPPAP